MDVHSAHANPSHALRKLKKTKLIRTMNLSPQVEKPQKRITYRLLCHKAVGEISKMRQIMAQLFINLQDKLKIKCLR